MLVPPVSTRKPGQWCGPRMNTRGAALGDGRDPVVLRIYHPGGRPEAEIRSELAWMAALRDEAGIPVPAVVPAPDGADRLDLGAPGPPVYAVAFAVVAGRELTDDLPATI